MTNPRSLSLFGWLARSARTQTRSLWLAMVMTSPACAGGETGDFGGSQTICGATAHRVVIDSARAAALGYDIAEIERRMARPIETSLKWVADPADGRGAPTGFDPRTSIRAALSIVEYAHWTSNPRFCDGTVCTLNGSSEPQSSCDYVYRLDLTVRISFETADGALRGTVRGQLSQNAVDALGRDTAIPVAVEASVDLAEVRGSLRLPGRRGGGPTSLILRVALSADSYSGQLLPGIEYNTPGTSQGAPERTLLVGYFPAEAADALGPMPAERATTQDAGATR